MKRIGYLSLLVIASQVAAQSRPLFETDVRVRVVNDTLVYVVVQIDNVSGRTVTELEGFLTESDSRSETVSEKKMVHIHKYDAPLRDGFTVVRGVTYPFNPSQSRRYRYHFSHIKFRNDPRIFVYHPDAGLIRIE
ncbi:MAG: hypothetical protein ACE5LH_05585 [Fidelibacterota bacterium]